MSHCFQLQIWADIKICLSKAIIAAKSVTNVLTRDKTNLETLIVYYVRFMHKVRYGILALPASVVCI